MKKILSSVIFFLLFWLQSPALSGDAIAVNELGASGINKSEAVSLTDSLRVELGKTGKYDVMERGQMETVLREQGFQQSGACGNASCAIEMGKLLAVKYIVVGNIGKEGKAFKTFTINIRLVEVETGKIVSEVTESYRTYINNLLVKKIPIAAQKLAGTFTKKEISGFKGAMLTMGVVAVAVPIVYFMTPEENVDEQSTTGVKVIWNE